MTLSKPATQRDRDALLAQHGLNGLHRLRGVCVCDVVPGLVCAYHLQVQCPPDTPEQMREAQREARQADRARKRGAWRKRLDRYARKGE